jgi:hypothetical protein
MEPLHSQAKSLLTAKPTRLFHRWHPGCPHPLSVLVEVATRRTFSLWEAFSSASPKRDREKYLRIADLAVMTVNDLALAHSTLNSPDGEDNQTGEWAEWSVFKHHTLARAAKNILPQLLTKALCAELHQLHEFLVCSPRSSMTTAAPNIAAALRHLLNIDTLLDEISAAAYRPVKWPSRQRKNRRVES